MQKSLARTKETTYIIRGKIKYKNKNKRCREKERWVQESMLQHILPLSIHQKGIIEEMTPRIMSSSCHMATGAN